MKLPKPISDHSMETESIPAAEHALESRQFTLRVFGVGGGGGNAIDYMARQDLTGVNFIAINTDAKALAQLGVSERMTLGAKLTRGLGSGGDPELGRAAAEEDHEKIRAYCAGADVVCVVAGLGGGTGTGAGPVVARIARETGALVLGIVTLPFEFEGNRRARQAMHGLRELKREADGVICLPNQKIYKLIDEKTAVPEGLKITNEWLAQGVRGIWRLLTHTGLINVDFNDLCAVLRGRHEESSLATVEAAGENRAHELIEKLNNHPFLECGQVLAEADAVLVSLAGGPDLTMADVNRVMEQINRQCENAHIIMGATIQESLTGRISVTLVASRQKSLEHVEAVQSALHGKKWDHDAHCKEIANPKQAERPASRYVAQPPALGSQQAEALLNGEGIGQNPRGKRKALPMRQGTLPLEIVSKGRFEKSEPTLHQGEDLDVPTYIRRGVALN